MTPDTTNPACVDMLYGAKLYYDKENKIQQLGCTLGADDKVGVFILLKMIEQNIPGLYLFHEGEEKGGIGSGKLALKKDIFEGYKRAIAFDRANYGDVICFQRGSRCCSVEFGKDLADRLNVNMPPHEKFKGEVHGTFTDTANYTRLIPECTNISVGYFGQHSSNEHLDYLWLKSMLLPAILQTDFESLIIKRDPTVTESIHNHSGIGHSTYYYGWKKSKINPEDIAWATIKEDATYLELPDWKPEMGYIEEAHPKVLLKCIQNYFKRAAYKDLEDVGEKYFSILEDLALANEELEELKCKIELAKSLNLNPDINTKRELISMNTSLGELQKMDLDL
jgi:hypothetical protein